eukprot:UN23022
MNSTRKSNYKIFEEFMEMAQSQDHTPEDLEHKGNKKLVVRNVSWSTYSKYTKSSPQPDNIWHGFGTALWKNHIYLVGGYTGQPEYPVSHQEIKVKSQEFQRQHGRHPERDEVPKLFGYTPEEWWWDFIGHEEAVDQFWRFNTETRTWKRLQNKVGKRHFPSVTLYKDSMYVLGGQDRSTYNKKKDLLYRYDFNKEQWFTVNMKKNSAFPYSLRLHNACISNNNLYVFGGVTGIDESVQTNALWEFNIEKSKWRKLGGGLENTHNKNWPEIRHQCAFWGTESGLYIYGGEYERPDDDNLKNYALRKMWFYDFKTKVWTIVEQYGNIPHPRIEFAYDILPGNKLFIFGGYNQDIMSNANINTGIDSYSYFNDSFIFDCKYKSWSMIQPKKDRKPLIRAGANVNYCPNKQVVY